MPRFSGELVRLRTFATITLRRMFQRVRITLGARALNRGLSGLLVRTRTLKIIPIVPIDSVRSERGGLLLGAGEAADAACRSIDCRPTHTQESPSRSDFPAVGWCEANGARVLGALRTGWIDSSGLRIEPPEHEAMRSLPRTHSTKVLKFPGLVSYDSREAAFRDEDPQRCLAEAIYAGGALAGNWYHWLLEILPRIWLTRLLPGEYVETPILVPERVLGSPNHRASLEQIVGSDRIVALPSWGAIDVERLVWIDGMFDMAHIASPLGGPHPSRFHQAGMREYRKDLGAIGHHHRRWSGPERVFLDRGNHSRRFNRDEVLAVVQRHGFTAVDAGALSFQEQVRLFGAATAVVGPSGAAWSNLLFARPELQGIYWLPDSLAGSRLWSSLADISGCSVYEMTYSDAVRSYHSESDYRVEPDRLDAALSRWLPGP